MYIARYGVDSCDSSNGGEGMKFVDNDHLFCYNDPLQQELQLALVDEDVNFDWLVVADSSHPLYSNVLNERDLEVMLDSVGCIDHPD